jgi:hypothetical protein
MSKIDIAGEWEWRQRSEEENERYPRRILARGYSYTG